MRILFFCKIFANPTLTFVYNEVEYLTRVGHEVLVLTLERKNKDKFPFNRVICLPKYEFIERKIRHLLQSNDFEVGFTDSKVQKELNFIVNEFDPDVIHTHFGFESWPFILNYLPGLKPIIITLHGFDVSHKLGSLRYRRTMSNVLSRRDLFPIFISQYGKFYTEKKLKQKIDSKLLFCGIDVSLFKRTERKLEKNPFIFVQISSFAEKKGHLHTIIAFNMLRNASKINVKLILAGDGIQKGNSEKLVAELNLNQIVEFTGLVNSTEARILMNEAHCFVHHSITTSIGDTEGIPNAIMEAMAMELPIISTYHAGIPELVEDGVNGYLVQERDVEAYAEAMYKIMSWDYLPQNRAKIEAQFEKEKHGQLLESYYREAIEEMKNR